MQIKHTIVIPERQKGSPNKVTGPWQEMRTYNSLSCLHVLPAFEWGIRVIVDSNVLRKRTPEPIFMGDRCGRFDSFFMVDDHLFMTADCDDTAINCNNWVTYYAENNVCAYFIVQHRRCNNSIFANCPIPVFPIPCVVDMRMPHNLFEHAYHSDYLSKEKDISVFFSGKLTHRVARDSWSQTIREKIPNSVMLERDSKSAAKYIECMLRSKIIWCPRSVKARRDHECNGLTAREAETMCLEALVVRPSIGVYEPEPRIPGVHYVEVENQNSDLIEKLEYYLEHDKERKKIAHNGRLWFERNSSSLARAYHLLNRSLEVIDEI